MSLIEPQDASYKQGLKSIPLQSGIVNTTLLWIPAMQNFDFFQKSTCSNSDFSNRSGIAAMIL